MNIGERIVAARKNAGIAQFELAEIANIRYNTIARIENGTLEPRLDLLEQIADILQVPMSVLLFGDETIDINITSRTLGWRIRMLRKESRMTQPELAQKAGISLTMLRQWELHPANPTISALEKIAEVFHISLKKLLTDTSKNKQPSINIGAKIAYARERAKLSQNDLAKKLNVTSAVIGKWETNRIYPKFNILEQIANALGISVLSLISGEAASNQPKPENYASPKINTEFDEVISELIIANDRLADRIWEARNRGTTITPAALPWCKIKSIRPYPVWKSFEVLIGYENDLILRHRHGDKRRVRTKSTVANKTKSEYRSEICISRPAAVLLFPINHQI